MFDPWHPLRRLTAARIALGRTGGSLPTRELLDFRLAHGRARDAVLAPFDAPGLAQCLRLLGMEVLCVESAATSKAEFLRRPDLGRTLSEASCGRLTALAESRTNAMHAAQRSLASHPTHHSCDLAIIVSDGLSSRAASEQSGPLLAALLPLVSQAGWNVAPLIVATHGRVALQDEIGSRLGARLSLMLLGERPGLGAANSLGAYFTYDPRPGTTDARRNCVSNIRSEGLPPAAAAHKIFHLLAQSLRCELSGVELKDDATPFAQLADTSAAAANELTASGG